MLGFVLIFGDVEGIGLRKRLFVYVWLLVWRGTSICRMEDKTCLIYIARRGCECCRASRMGRVLGMRGVVFFIRSFGNVFLRRWYWVEVGRR